jgi:hypothetical protein
MAAAAFLGPAQASPDELVPEDLEPTGDYVGFLESCTTDEYLEMLRGLRSQWLERLGLGWDYELLDDVEF